MFRGRRRIEIIHQHAHNMMKHWVLVRIYSNTRIYKCSLAFWRSTQWRPNQPRHAIWNRYKVRDQRMRMKWRMIVIMLMIVINYKGITFNMSFCYHIRLYLLIHAILNLYRYILALLRNFVNVKVSLVWARANRASAREQSTTVFGHCQSIMARSIYKVVAMIRCWNGLPHMPNTCQKWL